MKYFMLPDIDKVGSLHLSRAIKGFNENRPKMFSKNACFWSLLSAKVFDSFHECSIGDNDSFLIFQEFLDRNSGFVRDYIDYLNSELAKGIKVNRENIRCLLLLVEMYDFNTYSLVGSAGKDQLIDSVLLPAIKRDAPNEEHMVKALRRVRALVKIGNHEAAHNLSATIMSDLFTAFDSGEIAVKAYFYFLELLSKGIIEISAFEDSAQFNHSQYFASSVAEVLASNPEKDFHVSLADSLIRLKMKEGISLVGAIKFMKKNGFSDDILRHTASGKREMLSNDMGL